MHSQHPLHGPIPDTMRQLFAGLSLLCGAWLSATPEAKLKEISVKPVGYIRKMFEHTYR